MIRRPGFLFVLALPVAASLAHADNVRIAGFNYSGLIWMAFLCAGLFVLLTENGARSAERIPFPYLPWTAWFGWLWLSLLWCENHELRSVQDALQISMPLFMGILGSMFVRSRQDLELLMKVFRWTLPVLFLMAVAAAVGWLGGEEEQEQGDRVLALNVLLVGCVFLSGYPRRRLVPLLGWACCVGVTTLTGSRTATAVLLLMPVFHPLYSYVWQRPLVGLTLLALAIGLFYTPMFQQRFFEEGSGTLADLWHGDVLDFGRFEVWRHAWDEAQQHPWMGSGVGAAYHYVPTIWPDMYHIHNDFLRVLFETGSLGLFFFLAAMLWQCWDLAAATDRQPGIIRDAFAATLLGMIAMAITELTDNTLLYNVWYVNPLFGLMGAAYGARAGVGAGASHTAAAQRQGTTATFRGGLHRFRPGPNP